MEYKQYRVKDYRTGIIQTVMFTPEAMHAILCTNHHLGIVNEQEDIKDKPDVVNKPRHYNQYGIECIDAIQASMSVEEFKGYLKGNIEKYIWRYTYKNGIEDLKKAQWYLNKLISVLDK